MLEVIGARLRIGSLKRQEEKAKTAKCEIGSFHIYMRSEVKREGVFEKFFVAIVLLSNVQSHVGYLSDGRTFDQKPPSRILALRKSTSHQN